MRDMLRRLHICFDIKHLHSQSQRAFLPYMGSHCRMSFASVTHHHACFTGLQSPWQYRSMRERYEDGAVNVGY
jgi:hypothetical protein